MNELVSPRQRLVVVILFVLAGLGGLFVYNHFFREEEVDATGVKCVEDAETLDDGDGGRMAELYRRGADADSLRRGGELPDAGAPATGLRSGSVGDGDAAAQARLRDSAGQLGIPAA